MSKKPPPAEKENHERWVISYADLVTLLLGFFIILYSLSEVDVRKFDQLSTTFSRAFNVNVKQGAEGGSPLFSGTTGLVPGSFSGQIAVDATAVQHAIDQQEQTAGLPQDISVIASEDKIVIRLADNLLFASGSADVRPDALPLLRIVADTVRNFGNDVRVEGHTDNIPVGTTKYPSNWELSAARATAVLRYMAEQANLDPKHLYAAGYGEFHPIASNATPEGRALNRRADVVLLYPSAKIKPSQPSSSGSDQGLRPSQAVPPVGRGTGSAGQ